jgi:hypothetical protein
MCNHCMHLIIGKGGFLTPQESYQIFPGDSFKTTCYYEDGGKFGRGSDDEMCIAFIMYYPARDLLGMPWICPYGVPDYGSGCATELEQGDLGSAEELGRSFGASPGACVATTSSTATAVPPVSTEPAETTAGSTVSSTATAAPPVYTESPSDAAKFGVSFVLQAVSVFVVAMLL